MTPRVPRAPAFAVGLLVAGAAVQLALPGEPVTPAATALRVRRPPAATTLPGPVPPRPEIARLNLFAPTRGPDGGAALAAADGTPAADALEGATLLGTARSRNFAAAVVRDGGGRASSLRVGARVGDWRLVVVARDAAVFARGGERRTLAVGRTAEGVAAPAGNDVVEEVEAE